MIDLSGLSGIFLLLGVVLLSGLVAVVVSIVGFKLGYWWEGRKKR